MQRPLLLSALAGLWVAIATAGGLPQWALDGERLEYTLSYLRVIGGTLVLEQAHEPVSGVQRLRMTALSSPFVSQFTVVDDDFETVLDPVRVTTLMSCKRTHEGKRRLEELVVFDPVFGTARRWRDNVEQKPIKARAPVLDTLSAVLYLRTLPLAPGRAFKFDVQSGADTYPLIVVVTSKKRLRTASGTIETFVVQPRFREGFLAKKEGKLTLWVTTDETHTPVRIESEAPFGSLTATLTRVQRPWSSVVESGCGSRDPGKEKHGP